MPDPFPPDGAPSFRIDLERIIDRSARRVPATDLSGQFVRVIDPKQIDSAIARAVEEALRAQEQKLGQSARREVGLEASRRFVTLMGEHQQAVEERREAIRARRELEGELATLREQLATERVRLRSERLAAERARLGPQGGTSAPRAPLTLSDDGLRELEAHLRRVTRVFMVDQRRRRAGEPPGIARNRLVELERALGRVLHRVIVKERLQAPTAVGEVSLRELEQLERKIAGLEDRLGDRERELKTLRETPARGRRVPPEAPAVGEASPEKRAVLAVIFNENLKLRADLSAAS